MKALHYPIGMLCMALAGNPAMDQSALVREGVEEVNSTIFRSATRETAEQLAKAGGRVAIEEVLETASREGGETLMKQAAKFIGEHGDLALRAVKDSPAKIIPLLEEVSPGLRKSAMQVLVRDGEHLLPLIDRYGSRVLETAARHPGVGDLLIERIGPEVMELAPRLGDDQAILLARHAEDIGRLKATDRSALLSDIKRAPGQVLDYLEKHPRVLTAATAGVTVYALRDRIFGSGGVPIVDPDGHRVRPSGLISRCCTGCRICCDGSVMTMTAAWVCVC